MDLVPKQSPLRRLVSAKVWKAELRRRPLVGCALFVGLFTRLLHWQWADRRFEDGLITVTHARNAVQGLGLTHHPYEPVTHGFTSALSVLVPLVGEILHQVISVMDGMVALRLSTMIAFVVTILVADAICQRLSVDKWPRGFVLLYLAVDYNHIFYGMAGMETQIGVAILLAAVLATMDRRAVAAGLLYGLAVLARPDFVLFDAVAFASIFLWNKRAGLKAAVICAAVVAPWVVFTTMYYGSPIPNTILAKALRYHVDFPASLSAAAWFHFIAERISDRVTWWKTFTPFLEDGFVTDAPLLPILSVLIAITLLGLAFGGGLVTRRIPGWRAALAFMLIFVVYRVFALPPTYYEWYYPPFTALVAICAGAGLTRLGKIVPRTVAVTAAGLAAVFAWPFPAHLILDEVVQHQIEDTVRAPLGLWLHDNVQPGEIVVSESAGYVGFYGGVKLYDYPGLTSKEAYRIMKEIGPKHSDILTEIAVVRPSFVVLRFEEYERLQEMYPPLARDYEEAARFSVRLESNALRWGGVTYQNPDRKFLILRHLPPGRARLSMAVRVSP
jgi:hypothetical protein